MDTEGEDVGAHGQRRRRRRRPASHNRKVQEFLHKQLGVARQHVEISQRQIEIFDKQAQDASKHQQEQVKYMASLSNNITDLVAVLKEQVKQKDRFMRLIERKDNEN